MGFKIRPGGHDTLPAKPIDISAFSLSRKTAQLNPRLFLKRGSGNGGGPASSSESPLQTPATQSVAKGKTQKKCKMRNFQASQTCLAERGGLRVATTTTNEHGRQSIYSVATKFDFIITDRFEKLPLQALLWGST